MANTIEKLAHNTGAKSKELINKARDHVEHLDDHAYQAGKHAKKIINTAEEHARKFASHLEEYVKERPITSITSAVILGLFLGKLLSNKRD